MNFKEALKKLDIEEYGDRIFNSNSHGELMHLIDYIDIAQSFDDLSWFKAWFLGIIEYAEDNWNRPESVFQHIPECITKTMSPEQLHTLLKKEQNSFIIKEI